MAWMTRYSEAMLYRPDFLFPKILAFCTLCEMTPQGGPAQMEAWMKPGIKGRRDVSVTAIVDPVKVRLHRVHTTAR